VSVFSEDILSENGELNRKKLGSIVFSDKEKLELLNKTIFPYIIKEIEEISIQNSDKNIVLDAPTLFESGLHTSCDIIVSAIANRDLRIKRITERDGISLDDALKRINSQKTEEFFRSNSDYIIENNNGLGELKAASLNVVNSIKEKIFEKA
jgi:dephospho-CoA kinase